MLRSYTVRLRLNKHWKLCTQLRSLSQLQRPTPTIHHSNIRLIQSALHTPRSPSHKSYFNPLQILNKRSFSLPEHEIIGLPALSPSVEESKIVAWKAKEGDFVAADTAIASVQTDKAELDWMLTDDVYLAKILLQPGDQVPVGTPACIFVDSKKDIDAFKNYSPDTPSDTAPPSPPTPPPQSSATVDTSNYPEHKVEGMPALSPTAVDGAVVEWLVKEGDMIEEGTGIAEIQTDKSVVTWTSTDEAYVAKLLVSVSPETKLLVGTPLAVFVDNKNDVAAFKDFVAGTAPSQSAAVATPNVAADSPQPSIQFRHGVRETDTDTAKPTAKAAATAPSGGRIFASPYARKLAAEMGIALDSIATGTGGKVGIVAVDVIKASQQKLVTVPQPVAISGDRSYEDIAVSAMREIIGKRLSESKFSSPHFYVTMECMMDSLIRMREEINVGEDSKISVNDFVIKACAAALRDTPDCNVGWIVDQKSNKTVLRKYNYIDISVAVATPNGLITPIIKDADRKSLSEISAEMKSLAKKAKDNKLLPEEFQGGTFTVSNMGMFGVSNFTAIINPPQSCILAVGGTKKKLAPDSSERGFKTVSAMEVTLSSDHRSVDGALAAIWVNAFQKYIEKPSKLMR